VTVLTDLAPRPAPRHRAPAVPVVPEPCFTTGDPPLPMGCALCGHPPYAHGCSAVGAHDYEVPSAALMAERLHLYTALGLHRRRMSEAEFQREHVCAPAQVASEADAAQGGNSPLGGPADPVSATTPAAETDSVRAATPRPSGARPPDRWDVHRIGQTPTVPPPGRRRTAVPPASARPSGVYAQVRSPRAARVHTPDVSPRQRPHRGRVPSANPPNRPNRPERPQQPERPEPAGRQQRQEQGRTAMTGGAC
jgi:hypothetical protein